MSHIYERGENLLNTKEFKELYSKYFNDVYKFLLSISRDEQIAEEIAQETFFKALKSIEQFNGQCKPLVWLCQIAKNTYFSYYRKNKKNKELIQEEETYEFENLIENKETAREIHRCLHNLKEPYKEVFTLRIFGELPFSQIAELFRKTESWARVTFYRAKTKLKEELK